VVPPGRTRRLLRKAAIATIVTTVLFVAGAAWSTTSAGSHLSGKIDEVFLRESHSDSTSGNAEERGSGREEELAAEPVEDPGEEAEEREELLAAGGVLPSPSPHNAPPPPPRQPPTPPVPKYGTCGDAPPNMQPRNVREFDYCPKATGAARRFAPRLNAEAPLRPKRLGPLTAAMVQRTRARYASMGSTQIKTHEDKLASILGMGFQTSRRYTVQRGGGRGCGEEVFGTEQNKVIYHYPATPQAQLLDAAACVPLSHC